MRGCSSRAAGAAAGFATAPAGGGATTTTGRDAGVPAEGRGGATTAPDGGREAMAGAAGGWAIIGGAGRGCGTILRGSGRAGGTATRTGAAGAAVAAGAAALAGGATAGFVVTCGWRASSSSSFFLARMAFITSPGLEMCERSILGTMGCAPGRVPAAPAYAAGFASCPKCARTFSASSSSSELECVLTPATPSSERISIIARGFTSNSRARSLIRTLLIRLFSVQRAAKPCRKTTDALSQNRCTQVDAIIRERRPRTRPTRDRICSFAVSRSWLPHGNGRF